MGFGGFEGEYVKILYSKLQKALTCMNTRLYRVTKSVQSLSARTVGRFCVQRNKERKKMSGNFGYVRKSSPLRDLDQIHHVNKYGRRSHVCKAWWLLVKECEFGNLPFPIDFRYRSYNIGHRVILMTVVFVVSKKLYFICTKKEKNYRAEDRL